MIMISYGQARIDTSRLGVGIGQEILTSSTWLHRLSMLLSGGTSASAESMTVIRIPPVSIGPRLTLDTGFVIVAKLDDLAYSIFFTVCRYGSSEPVIVL